MGTAIPLPALRALVACYRENLYPYANTHWLIRLWSTQAKVEGIVLMGAWDWGSDSSVINDLPLGNQATPHSM